MGSYTLFTLFTLLYIVIHCFSRIDKVYSWYVCLISTFRLVKSVVIPTFVLDRFS